MKKLFGQKKERKKESLKLQFFPKGQEITESIYHPSIMQSKPYVYIIHRETIQNHELVETQLYEIEASTKLKQRENKMITLK